MMSNWIFKGDSGTPTQSIWTGPYPAAEATNAIFRVLRRAHRRLPILSLWTSVFVAAAVVYVRIVPPSYIATNEILIQPRVIVNDGPEELRRFYQFMVDNAQCETELRTLTAERLLRQVYETLTPLDVKEIGGDSNGLWGFVSHSLDNLWVLTSPDIDKLKTFENFAGRVRARRIGLSYVIEVSYRSSDAQQSAQIVNKIATTYAAYKLRGVLARDKLQGVFLESRMSNLIRQITDIDSASEAGTIPDISLTAAGVRLLGPARLPVGLTYPKLLPLAVMLGGLGLLSGILIIILSGLNTKIDTLGSHPQGE
ncbi:hypothetical protein FV228_23520 [Methylobacterium sp. WL18]|uniref:hypothetical protein n=1 Tax=Methylobacterium sp. WL18 TaxID=2603897 RepID=UPI0011CBA001|nr:hypothetical protein [Methylobacterium sp. WL18]TXN60332.1 hypothetical protein FV228_23520 [Methylobacterium sp. WL18]